MKTIEFPCDDCYEAEKLASLLSVQKDNSVWVSAVLAMAGNEIVIQLKDLSSHAVILKDEETVARLGSFLMDVLKGKITIYSSCFDGSIAGITILD